MSLFEAREWWSSSVESKEEFVQGAIAVGNIDNSSNGNGKTVSYRFFHENGLHLAIL